MPWQNWVFFCQSSILQYQYASAFVLASAEANYDQLVKQVFTPFYNTLSGTQWIRSLQKEILFDTSCFLAACAFCLLCDIYVQIFWGKNILWTVNKVSSPVIWCWSSPVWKVCIAQPRYQAHNFGTFYIFCNNIYY